MEIQEYFKNRLKRKEERGKAEKFREKKEDEAERKRLKCYAKKEDKNLDAKIEICRKVFSFRKKFLETPEGKMLFKKSGSDLWVFAGNWGHKLHDKGDEAAQSRIYFTSNGISYSASWKWMGSLASFSFKEPEEMARNLSLDYLKEMLNE